MIYILLSILCSIGILVIFKLGDRLGANTRHIIVVGYLISALASAVIFSVSFEDFFSRWFVVALFEGAAFYIVFRLMAISAETSGISVTSVASKMSVVIPIAIGIVVLGESINALVVLGIICGLIAVWLTVGRGIKLQGWSWPLLVFVSAGLVDASFKLFQVYGLTEAHFPVFLTTTFSFAFLVGLIHHLTYQERAINQRSVMAGIVLGLVNLGSAYFILLALAMPGFQSIFVYSLTNFGVVIGGVLVAIVIFREQVTAKGWLGLALAAGSIALLYKGYV
jgi:drug/metabolite transporter (DMT)-like permease